jgi:hypothetical protein
MLSPAAAAVTETATPNVKQYACHQIALTLQGIS